MKRKRTPYAVRACEACRRRKGKCNGHKPCSYCAGRSIECLYVDFPNEHFGFTKECPIAGGNGTQVEDTDSNKRLVIHRIDRIVRKLNFCSKIESLVHLVSKLQGQVEVLSAKLSASQPSENPRTSVAVPASLPQGEDIFGETNLCSMAPVENANSTDRQSRHLVKRFDGPTSPEYSFDIAQLNRAENQQISPEATHNHSLSINEDQSEEDITSYESANTSPCLELQARSSTERGLFHFRTLLTKDEALGLVRSYNDVIDGLHPICNVDAVLTSIDEIYNGTTTSSTLLGPTALHDELNMLIINMILCIALYADLTSQTAILTQIFHSCRDRVYRVLGHISMSTDQITLALLLVRIALLPKLGTMSSAESPVKHESNPSQAYFYYFCGRINLACRMCGFAGRLAMELGLHKNIAQSSSHQDHNEKSSINIMHSLLILDRQWSIAAGLPPNFQLADFEMITDTPAHTPYLKAMLALILVAHEYNAPVSNFSSGAVYDDDTYELLDFRIQQWRRKSLEDHGFTHPDNWTDASDNLVSSWTIAIYLRGNAVRLILLRPFFLTQSQTPPSRTKLAPALNLIADTMNVVFLLDSHTDIYRKHLPFFQHFLASSAALLSLVASFVQYDPASTTSNIPPQSMKVISNAFEKALYLSTLYKEASVASNKLWRRLTAMRKTLAALGLGPIENGIVSTSTTSFPRTVRQGYMKSLEDDNRGKGWVQPVAQELVVGNEFCPSLEIDPSWLISDNLDLDWNRPGLNGFMNFDGFNSWTYV